MLEKLEELTFERLREDGTPILVCSERKPLSLVGNKGVHIKCACPGNHVSLQMHSCGEFVPPLS